MGVSTLHLQPRESNGHLGCLIHVLETWEMKWTHLCLLPEKCKEGEADYKRPLETALVIAVWESIALPKKIWPK